MKQIAQGIILCIILFSHCDLSYAQWSVLDHSWEGLVYQATPEWYASDDAKRVAENVLLYQRDIGGWPKNIAMHKNISNIEKEELLTLKTTGKGATIDNCATVSQLDFLSKIYEKRTDETYKKAFLKGVNYLLEAQYDNGGWPQFYPLEPGDYSTHITYNDNAMVNVMNVMKAIAERSDRFSIPFEDSVVSKAKEAFESGLNCIVNTQYYQNGILTAWCAQHDELTLLPANARSYELASLSGSESVGILSLLMSVDHPSAEIIKSVDAAATWFELVKITGIRVEHFKNEDGKTDRRIVQDDEAPPVWARFYQLEDNQPIFCDRDGIKKYSMAEIGQERRGGYAWYKGEARDVLEYYYKWKKKWNPEPTVNQEEID